jgi:hypothetical protein
MVDMSMCYNDLLQLEPTLFQARHDLRNVVARIDHHGFAGRLIAKDSAVALQHANRKSLKDHILIVSEAAQNAQNE